MTGDNTYLKYPSSWNLKQTTNWDAHQNIEGRDDGEENTKNKSSRNGKDDGKKFIEEVANPVENAVGYAPNTTKGSNGIRFTKNVREAEINGCMEGFFISIDHVQTK